MNEPFVNEALALEVPVAHKILSKKVIVSIIVSFFLAVSIFFFSIYSSETDQISINFQVSKLDTTETLARKLSDQGIIKHPLYFYLSYWFFTNGEDVRPGAYKLSNVMSTKEIVNTLNSLPDSKIVNIPAGSSKEQISKILSEALGWGTSDSQFFANVYAGMQWQNYQDKIREYFKNNYKWTNGKTDTFMSLSALYYDSEYDFFKNMFVPGVYEIPANFSRAQVAGILISKFSEKYPDSQKVIEKYIDKKSADKIADLVSGDLVLMPDIIAIPPKDLTLKKEDGRIYLLFSTLFWNKGRGALELFGDPKTKGATGDQTRNVFQRIYHLDGNYTDRLSGKFEWHDTHAHYHFKDFALYSIEPENENGVEKISQKTTFCIRDSEPIDLSHPGANSVATYYVCGKERQGISAGWADAYYYTYFDQIFDVSNFPKGNYKLKVIINPEDRFEEVTVDNNVGEVILRLDVENNIVEVISQSIYALEK